MRNCSPKKPNWQSIHSALSLTIANLEPACWIKGMLCVDDRGKAVDLVDAVGFCTQGLVLNHLDGFDGATVVSATSILHDAAKSVSGGEFNTIFEFNDAPGTGLDDVRNVLDTAKQLVEVKLPSIA